LTTNDRILIVDDTPDSLQRLSEILKKNDNEMSVAINGKQALDSLARILPDLILLDVMRPSCQSEQAS
jgi:two-component system, sensor histidine kinase and response regulator